MLYKETYGVLSSLESLLLQNKIKYPEQLIAFNKALKDSLDSGKCLTGKELQIAERYFFPDAGMGWINDVQYELEGENRQRFQTLIDRLYELWKSS